MYNESNGGLSSEPEMGFEPMTYSLRKSYSTPELHRHRKLFYYTSDVASSVISSVCARMTSMKAPDFNLPDQDGNIHKLKDFKGKWLIVYFYPKDDTPGCTKEACIFRDASEDYKNLGVSIIGISKDSIKSHKKFIEKHQLNFPLLADEDGKVVESYGAWGEKSLFGVKYTGILRNTYLINPKGEIVKVYEKVKPEIHSEQILGDLKTLSVSDNR